MTGQRPLTEEVTWPEHRHDRLFAAARVHRELDGALLNIQNAVGRLALGENEVGALIGHDSLPRPCGTEKRVRVERSLLLDLHDRWIFPIIAQRRFGVVVSGPRLDHAFVTAGLMHERTIPKVRLPRDSASALLTAAPGGSAGCSGVRVRIHDEAHRDDHRCDDRETLACRASLPERARRVLGVRTLDRREQEED
jgi:hypothetical protein